ncbi:hypothetical protein HBI56_234060 [Parastagonospora nodorum]|nr:hypothetical protein HBI10_234630 [Parastagonospora nodorum]KAH4008923.1 hypothetical protein HBI13_228230 [Parastagonospora nodorum]KAH4294064.1 hypothetical protein HBI01_170970 [Parastagonospora nodorum]KAH4296752.1 hypothetical protein HBI02_169800 [Parastagonospora nodorum]KAH4325166.1 hypothetical protein HBI00_161590 [Parastagonospora nodorum]
MKFGKLTDEAVINIFTMFYPTFLLPFDSVTVLFKDSPGFRGLCRDMDRPTPKAVSSGFLAMDELFRTINNAKNLDQYRPAPRFKYLPFHQQPVRASPNGLLGDLFFPLCGNGWVDVDCAELPKTKRTGIAYGVRKPENQDATVFFYPYSVCDRQIYASIMQDHQYQYTENYRIYSEHGIMNNHNWALTNPGEIEIAPRTFNKRYITEPPAEPCKAVRLCSAS